MIVNLHVTSVNLGRKHIGYSVAGFHRACSDSLWEPIAHAAIFTDPFRAKKFLSKIKARGRIDWQHWGVPFGHAVSSIDAFKYRPPYYTVL
jgi:hypothetical protein